MIFDYGMTVTRLRRRHVKAEHGNAMVLPSWDDPDNPPDEEEIHGVAIAPGSGMFSTRRSESLEREQAISTMSLYGPVDVDLKVGDRVKNGDSIWEVAGDPRSYTHPLTGWAAGSETPLESVRG